LGEETHEPLGIAPKSLHKRLHERSHLVSTDLVRGRLTVRKTLQGQNRVVLHLRADVLGVGSSAELPPSRNGS
jgi:hypothetical protein